MNDMLKKWKDESKAFQDSLRDKIEKGTKLSDEEVARYEVMDSDKEMLEVLEDVVSGNSAGFDMNDFLSTPQAQALIPKVIIGSMVKAADPIYLASKFFKPIRLKTSNAVVFPKIGVMRAYDVAEGQEIPQETIDWNYSTNDTIKVRKSGIRVQYSEELVQDSTWDIIAMLVSEAGRAMARHTEQKAFIEFMGHGWTVFDNQLRATIPEAGTTGQDFDGNLNDTMSLDDYLDLYIACYNNGHTPTDTLMHPLVWPAFVKSGMTGGLSAPMDREAKRTVTNGKVTLGPNAVQGRLPFGLSVSLSPFVPINKVNKTFNMFVVDRNNVGVHIIRENMRTEQFRDPARDIHNLKIIKRDGFGVMNEGRAVASAKNISMAKSWPQAERVYNINSK